MTSLDDRRYFPTFEELPLVDGYDDSRYYEDVCGSVVPKKHWCFFAEIVDDSLSQEAAFFHRVEVCDLTGARASLLFTAESQPEYALLRRGATVFVRYATKSYFSDLITQVIKVEDPAFVQVVPASMDDLMLLSGWYLGSECRCSACGKQLSSRAAEPQVAATCSSCEAAHWCSSECFSRHQDEHGAKHCALIRALRAALDVDHERFIQAVPFRGHE